MSGGLNYIRDGAAIYKNSFAIIRAESRLARFTPEQEKVAVRMIHACGMVELADVPWQMVVAFDDRHVAAPRHTFLHRWLNAPGSMGVGVVSDGHLVGMASMRACRNGYRFGPVHADTPQVADATIRALLSRIPGEPVQIDIPEPNEAGLAIAARLGMTESFGCARLYFGEAPELPTSRIFGVTSFEFG